MALAPDDNWVVLYDTSNYVASANVPSGCTSELNLLRAGGSNIKMVALGSNSQWVVVYGTNQAAWSSGLASSLQTGLNGFAKNGDTDTALTLSSSDANVVVANNYYFSSSTNVPVLMRNTLVNFQLAGNVIYNVLIGPNNDWAVLANTTVPYNTYGLPPQMVSDIETIYNSNLTVTCMAEGISGDYMILYGNNGYYVHSANGRLYRAHRSR